MAAAGRLSCCIASRTPVSQCGGEHLRAHPIGFPYKCICSLLSVAYFISKTKIQCCLCSGSAHAHQLDGPIRPRGQLTDFLVFRRSTASLNAAASPTPDSWRHRRFALSAEVSSFRPSPVSVEPYTFGLRIVTGSGRAELATSAKRRIALTRSCIHRSPLGTLRSCFFKCVTASLFRGSSCLSVTRIHGAVVFGTRASAQRLFKISAPQSSCCLIA